MVLNPRVRWIRSEACQKSQILSSGLVYIIGRLRASAGGLNLRKATLGRIELELA
jgi:hypothetical protein